MKPATIQHIPTHIVMGFLGSGKTTAILNFFKQKPDHERWAVLVNEFGEMGIDGQIYQQQGITVKEISGGCMCCVQGVPMRVAINHLLRQTHPDRLLIESSGVGHPSGLLRTLTSSEFQGVLDIKATITLLDPLKLLDERICGNDLFQDQLATADILIANKVDMASTQAMEAFKNLTAKIDHYQLIEKTTYAKVNLLWLELEHQYQSTKASEVTGVTPLTNPLTNHINGNRNSIPTQNRDTENWQSVSLSFKTTAVFSIDCLIQVIANNADYRIKGFLLTDQGICLVNAISGKADLQPISLISKQKKNTLQIIAINPNKTDLEMSFRKCQL